MSKLTDIILDITAIIPTPGFFVTVRFSKESDKIPLNIHDFLQQKLQLIESGITTRKFVFQESGWRMVFTFFPTDKVVDEKYAMKNTVFKNKRKT